MALVAPDLRPRGAAELYDAAIHLALRGGTGLAGLAAAGALLPGAAGLWLAHVAASGRPYLVWAALFALALMVRSIFAGAASRVAEAALEGEPVAPADALRSALRRAPSLMSAGGVLLLVHYALVPVTFGVGLLAWSPLLGAHALVARGEAGPFSMGRVCRARLAPEPTLRLRLLHGLVFALTLVNLHTGAWMALYLARALLGLDVTFLDQFTSLDNGMYGLTLLALAVMLLEPVKVALGLLLLVDARVRSEGLDLTAAADRLAARAARGSAAALVLLVLAAPGLARATDPRTLERLDQLIDELGLAGEEEVLEGRDAAEALEGPEAIGLGRMIERVRAAHERGENPDAVADELRLALAETAQLDGSSGPALEPREQARAILAREEFAEVTRTPTAERGWWQRLREWIKRLLDGLDGDDDPMKEPRRCGFGAPGVGAGASQVATSLLAVFALLVLAGVGFRLLLGRRGARSAPAQADAAEVAASPGGESALARSPRGWVDEAERFASIGDYREAVRAIYLAALSALHRRGLIDYDPARSNWDYVQAFRGLGAQLGPFRELTLRFDFAWYGRVGADQPGFTRARELARALLAEGEARADA